MVTTPNGSEALDASGPNRTRRAVFVFGGTIMFALLAALATWLREGEVAKVFVQGCLGVIELMVISYLFTTTIDRSEVLKNIGLGVRRYAGDPVMQPSPVPPPHQTQPQAPLPAPANPDDARG